MTPLLLVKGIILCHPLFKCGQVNAYYMQFGVGSARYAIELLYFLFARVIFFIALLAIAMPAHLPKKKYHYLASSLAPSFINKIGNPKKKLEIPN